MTSNSSARERGLVLLAPSALVLIVFAFLFNSDQQKKLQRQTEALEEAQESATSNADVLAESQKLGKLRLEQKSLAESESELSDQLKQQAARVSGTDHRNRRIRELIEHLRSHKLEISGGAPADNKNNSLPAALDTLTSRLQKTPGFQQPEVYEIQIFGSYPHVRRALQELSETEDELIPLRITMEKAKPGQLMKHWTLYVLI